MGIKPSLESVFHSLLRRAKKSPSLSLNEVLAILSGKGRLLCILFLSLPFCQPLQIPGLSTPFGLLIAFFGMRMVFGKGVWIPKKLKNKKISSKKLQKIAIKGFHLLKKMRRFVHPRLLWTCKLEKINGLLIAILGLLLALPLPIPLTNLVSAWALLLLSVGILEDDGVFILLGYLGFLIVVGFFVAISFSVEKIF